MFFSVFAIFLAFEKKNIEKPSAVYFFPCL